MVAKQPRKFSARDRRAVAKIALKAMKDPASLTNGQIRRLASVALAQVTYTEPPRRGRQPQAYRS